jgi:hypothetical protein
MADYNATFAANNDCTRLNTGGVNALCECRQECGNSLRRINKDRKRRARRSFTAGANCCSGHKNTLSCH